jgi:hypothetical protein
MAQSNLAAQLSARQGKQQLLFTFAEILPVAKGKVITL